jgi:hypothetical protein
MGLSSAQGEGAFEKTAHRRDILTDATVVSVVDKHDLQRKNATSRCAAPQREANSLRELDLRPATQANS